VLSENYGRSPWCLRELAAAMANKQERDQKVLPVFFGVSTNAEDIVVPMWASMPATQPQANFSPFGQACSMTPCHMPIRALLTRPWQGCFVHVPSRVKLCHVVQHTQTCMLSTARGRVTCMPAVRALTLKPGNSTSKTPMTDASIPRPQQYRSRADEEHGWPYIISSAVNFFNGVSWPCSCSEEEACEYTEANIKQWRAALAELSNITGLEGRCAKVPIHVCWVTEGWTFV
jgi:hypothetical protein